MRNRGLCGNGDLRTSCLTLEHLEKIFFRESDVDLFIEKHPEYKAQESPFINSKGEIPPYLEEKNNPHFSEEIFIAVDTWMAIYGPNGSLNPNKKHRQQILAYLEKKYRDDKKMFPKGYNLDDYINRKKESPCQT